MPKKRQVSQDETKLPQVPSETVADAISVGKIGNCIPTIAQYNESVRILKSAANQMLADEQGHSSMCRPNKPTRKSVCGPFE